MYASTLLDSIEQNIYQIKTPNFGDTDCGSERIVNAVRNITIEAFKYALQESDLTNPDKRIFIGDDLLKIAVERIVKDLTELSK